MRRRLAILVPAALVLVAALLVVDALTDGPTEADERTITAYVTGYSYFDNTPPRSDAISHPVVHRRAGGKGTYADPITVAVGHSRAHGRDALDWAPGTRFYVPSLRRYLVVEDTCGDGSRPQDGPCHTGYPKGASTWLDVWVGGAREARSRSDACMSSISRIATVVVDPARDYVVSAGPLSDSSCRVYGDTPERR
ncbi:hypothetical protein [Puerhibacterium puerhi]|uniref:hypothetical protein n=1 Tax=Puerhibacterium puerhi TaxID=2692623 RepID=UPI0019164A24|nr:hypothetical protein [Puerhibacterium puerhi]